MVIEDPHTCSQTHFLRRHRGNIFADDVSEGSIHALSCILIRVFVPEGRGEIFTHLADPFGINGAVHRFGELLIFLFLKVIPHKRSDLAVSCHTAEHTIPFHQDHIGAVSCRHNGSTQTAGTAADDNDIRLCDYRDLLFHFEFNRIHHATSVSATATLPQA